MIRDFFLNRKRADAKALWTNKPSPCEYASLVHDAASPPTWTRVLEFGANWGGNLEYFLARHPTLQAVGVDINPSVLAMAEREPRYTGIVGDESALDTLAARSFDLAFTVSVLDHIPSSAVVTGVIENLVRIAPRVLLLEPWIQGVEGDVSGRVRNQVKAGLEGGHKPFAPHSYLWNYDAILARLGLPYTKAPMPLHAHSFGPFYFMYSIGVAGQP